MTDLIKYLRSGRWFGATTGRKAADRIETLEAMLEAQNENCASLLERLAALTAHLQAKEDGLKVRDNRIRALEAACQGGRDWERAAIVKWLRDREKYGYSGYPAVAIEAGEHLK